MEKILITGGAGFIGSNTAVRLAEKGYKVVVLDNLSPVVHGDFPKTSSFLYRKIKGKVTFYKGTVNSKMDWEKVLPGVGVILHLAAETGTAQSMYEIEKYVSVNIGGTALLLDILSNTNHNVKKIIVAESRAVYGEGRYWSDDLERFVYPFERSDESMKKGDFEVKYKGCKRPLKLIATSEDSEIHPNSVYGLTKQVQGQLVHMVCKNLGIDSISLRYQNVYGPGQTLSNPYTGILSIFSTRIKHGSPIEIYEDGLESRDFVYIEDVVDATIAAIESEGLSGLAFNIGSGTSINVKTVAKKLIECYGINVPIKVTGQYRMGDIRHNYADISLAQCKLGYTPKWNFDDGIKKFVEWVESQPIAQDKYAESMKELKERGLYK